MLAEGLMLSLSKDGARSRIFDSGYQTDRSRDAIASKPAVRLVLMGQW
jgi:hypothetical protein